MPRRFVTVDVFTRQRFGGNPLAVVLDAEGLDAATMQRIAREFNLSETTFILPPRDPAHTAAVRIFTPRQEIPFAGHPNVGTAYVVAQHGVAGRLPGAGPLTFEEGAGLVPLDLLHEGVSVAGARLASPQPFARGDVFDAAVVAACCSLEPGAVVTARHAPCIATCGLPFVFAEVASRAALASAVPASERFRKDLPVDRTTGIALYWLGSQDGADVHLRMFAPLYGVEEDPATGSACVALAGLLATLAPEPDLSLRRTVAQGVDMGRPSLLDIEAEKRGGVVRETRVGGYCVPVMEGTIAAD